MKLSRHARNNMRLYGILEDDIIDAIQKPDRQENDGENMIVLKNFKGRFSGLPLKIAYYERGGEIFVITAYPLKKSYRRKT